MDYELLKRRGALNDGPSNLDEAVAEWVSAPATPKEPSLLAVDTLSGEIPSELLARIPESICRENLCFPIAAKDDRLYVAAIDADDLALKDKLTFVLGADVRLLAAPAEKIKAAINRHYTDDRLTSVDSMLCEFTETAVDFCETESSDSTSDSLPRPVRPPLFAAPNASATSHVKRRAIAASAGVEHRLPSESRTSMFHYTIPEGWRVLRTLPNGAREVLIGPRRVFRGWSEFLVMAHHVAHPGDYLIVRFRDGHQEHRIGPAEVWEDPRIHDRIERAEGLQIDSKEAIVVYSHTGATDQQPTATNRRIVYGPNLFVPQPGEWLHTFSWHASKGGSKGVEKTPNGLVFQKLWLMPDQMYHDVHDVRTSDDAVLTIRLMIFFELVNIELMLDATHDPIGDFVNAATADVVEFTGRYDFEAFKHNTEKLNQIGTYQQLASRAKQIGYHIHTVVYRGYGAASSLQQMHNQAIEARTKLQLDRATEQQAQELESYRLESQLARAAKRRSEQANEVAHDLELNHLRAKNELEIKETQQAFDRHQRLEDAKARDTVERMSAAQKQAHLASLREMGVELTSYLTQNRADQVFEFRGQAAPHVHLDPPKLAKKG